MILLKILVFVLESDIFVTVIVIVDGADFCEW